MHLDLKITVIKHNKNLNVAENVIDFRNITDEGTLFTFFLTK